MNTRIVGTVYCSASRLHIEGDPDNDFDCSGFFAAKWNETRIKIRQLSFYSIESKLSRGKEERLLSLMTEIIHEKAMVEESNG